VNGQNNGISVFCRPVDGIYDEYPDWSLRRLEFQTELLLYGS